jgi:hypothetical protein
MLQPHNTLLNYRSRALNAAVQEQREIDLPQAVYPGRVTDWPRPVKRFSSSAP